MICNFFSPSVLASIFEPLNCQGLLICPKDLAHSNDTFVMIFLCLSKVTLVALILDVCVHQENFFAHQYQSSDKVQIQPDIGVGLMDIIYYLLFLTVFSYRWSREFFQGKREKKKPHQHVDLASLLNFSITLSIGFSFFSILRLDDRENSHIFSINLSFFTFLHIS